MEDNQYRCVGCDSLVSSLFPSGLCLACEAHADGVEPTPPAVRVRLDAAPIFRAFMLVEHGHGWSLPTLGRCAACGADLVASAVGCSRWPLLWFCGSGCRGEWRLANDDAAADPALLREWSAAW